jgi:stage III sporulation protein AD
VSTPVPVLALVGFALVAVVCLVVLRPMRPELAVLLSLAAAAAIFAALLPGVTDILTVLRRLAEQGGVGGAYLGAVLRIIGVAYVAEFGAEIARDAGEGAIAAKVELGGKLLILAMAVPILLAILQLALSLLGGG